MARTRSTPTGSTGDDESFTDSEEPASPSTSEPEPSTGDGGNTGESSAVHVDDNNPSVTVLDVDEDAEPDDKVHCNCGAVEWDSQDAAMGAIAADMDGSRHTPDKCRDLEEIRAERAK